MLLPSVTRTRKLLSIRQETLMPLLDGALGGTGMALVEGLGFVVAWELQPGRFWHLVVNLSDEVWDAEGVFESGALAAAQSIYTNHKNAFETLRDDGKLCATCVIALLSDTPLIAEPDDE